MAKPAMQLHSRMPGQIVTMPLSDGAHRLYNVLAFCGFGGKESWYGQEELARMMHCCARTVRRRIVELVKAGLLVVRRRGRCDTNTYRVLASPQAPSSMHSDRTTPSTGSGQPRPTNDGTTVPERENESPPRVLDDARIKSLRYRAKQGDGWALGVLRRLKLLP